MIHFRLILLLLWALGTTMCGQTVTVQAPTFVPVEPTVQPTAAALRPVSGPTAVSAIEPTTPPTAVPTATAAPKPRIGIQVGHWKTESMPEEQAKLRKFTGNYYRGYDEWEINIAVAEKVRDDLLAAGYDAELISTTIPPGYQADAFIAIHANGTSTRPEKQRGWSLTPPWRASPAAQALAEAVAASYGRVTGMPEDTTGVSENMLGYYAFAHYRYQHAIAPTTPAIIIETGYMTNAADRAVIFEQPEIAARGITDGVVAFLQNANRSEAARQPVVLPMLKPSRTGTALLRQPRANSSPTVELDAEARLVPMGYRDGWYLAFTRGVWDLGWIAEADVVALDEPQTPPVRP